MTTEEISLNYAWKQFNSWTKELVQDYDSYVAQNDQSSMIAVAIDWNYKNDFSSYKHRNLTSCCVIKTTTEATQNKKMPGSCLTLVSSTDNYYVTQQLTTPAVRWQSVRSTTTVVWCQSWTWGCINICSYFVFKTQISPHGGHLGEDLNAATESAMSTSPIVFYRNYGPILLSFWDMTTGRTGGQTDIAAIAYPRWVADLQQCP